MSLWLSVTLIASYLVIAAVSTKEHRWAFAFYWLSAAAITLAVLLIEAQRKPWR